MAYAKNVDSLILVILGVIHVMLSIFNKISKNWTSGNNEVDKFIQKAQIKAKMCIVNNIEAMIK